MRKVIVAVLVVITCLGLVMIGCAQSAPPAPAREVTVGNKNFTEQYVVGQLTRQVLEDRGLKVELVSDLSSPELRERMEAGQIDVCTEYTGTAWMVHLAHVYEAGMDNNEIYRLVRDEDEANGFVWLDPMWNNNTYALASWPDFAEGPGLKTLSDLASLYREREGEIKTFVSQEFSIRPDGMPALERQYDFEVAEGFLLVGKPEASLKGLEEHECDVAMVFGTDAAIAKHGWHVYIDDKSFFPPYDLTPCVRKEVLDTYPEIADVLNELVATFPGGGEPATSELVAECQQVWQELNDKVDSEKTSPYQVAREYLLKHGSIKE